MDIGDAQTMTVMAYLFDYTLNVLFEGNKSECARKLGIRRTDLNRIQQRFAEGATSVRAIEAIVNLFWKENYSLDHALRGYMSDDAASSANGQAVPDNPLRMLREEMEREWHQAGTRMRLFKSAEAFMAQLEHSFCTEECRELRDCQTECPCKRFSELIDWLRQELEKLGPSAEGEKEA